MASGPKAFMRVGAVVLGVLALVVQGEVAGQTGSDLSVVRAVEDYRLGQLDQARAALERSFRGRLSEEDRGVALVYLGLIELAVGRDPARFFREAVLADPALELDPAAHAPARIQRFDEIRRRLLEVATIEIVLGADSIGVGRETTVGVRVVNTEGLELRNLPVRYSARGPGELVVVGGEDRVRGLRAGEVTVEAEVFLTGPPRRVAKPIWVVEVEVPARATRPTAPARPQATADPVPPRDRKTRSVYVSPRAGLSFATGLVGLEVQYKHFAVSAGTVPEKNLPLFWGARSYFAQATGSWFIGICGLIYNDIYSERGVGLVAGYRFRSRGGWELNLGTGVGQHQRVEHSFGADHRYDRWLPVIDLAIGHAF